LRDKRMRYRSSGAQAKRGADITQQALFTPVHLETFVPTDHALCPIRAMVNEALGRMSGLFHSMYAEGAGESITPERQMRPMRV